MDKEILLKSIEEKFGNIVNQVSEPHNFLTLEVDPDKLKPLIKFLKDDETCNFVFLTDICGVHYPSNKEKEFAVVYHLHNWEANFRLRLKTFVNRENISLPTISDIYSGANWMERETFDFFGIIFTGHPKMIRILNMEDMDYHPMRKEYPMEDATRTDKDDRFFGRDGNSSVKFDNRKSIARDNG